MPAYRRVDAHVLEVGPDRHCQVGGQGPGGGRPHQQVVTGYGRAPSFDHFEPDGERGVLDVPVVHVCFEVRQRGRRPVRVGEDLEVPVDEPLVPQAAEHPPDRLHVAQVQGLVVVLEVHPAPDAAGVGLPGLGVGRHPGSGGLVEALHPESLDLGRSREPELLLNLHLDGEAVGVPAEAAHHPVPAHRPVARHDVLEHPGEEGAVVGAPGRERRPVVEGELGFLGAHGHRGSEGADLIPQAEHLLLEPGEGDFGGCSGECPVLGHDVLGRLSPAAGTGRARGTTRLAAPVSDRSLPHVGGVAGGF